MWTLSFCKIFPNKYDLNFFFLNKLKLFTILYSVQNMTKTCSLTIKRVKNNENVPREKKNKNA